MAMYMAICRQRSLGIDARKEMEAAFRRSNPVEGQQLFMSLDNPMKFTLWLQSISKEYIGLGIRNLLFLKVFFLFFRNF